MNIFRRAQRLTPVLLVLLPGLALAAPDVASGYDTSGAANAITWLNQQREANGIPPLTLDQSTLKQSCTLADHWIASPSTQWNAEDSPWDNAPLHQEWLYNPFATTASYAVYGPSESDFSSLGESVSDWTCMWFGVPSSNAPAGAQPAFYSFTAANGPGDVPVSETASEWPTTPNAIVGLNNPTGPKRSRIN